jgi:hypothetical protein
VAANYARDLNVRPSFADREVHALSQLLIYAILEFPCGVEVGPTCQNLLKEAVKLSFSYVELPPRYFLLCGCSNDAQHVAGSYPRQCFCRPIGKAKNAVPARNCCQGSKHAEVDTGMRDSREKPLG